MAFAGWKGNDQVLFSFRPYQLFTVFNISARVFKNLTKQTEHSCSRYKKTPEAISVITESRQVFGVILCDKIYFSEALKYLTTSISLSIGNSDDTLRQSLKNTFWNFLIDQRNAIEFQPSLPILTEKLLKTYQWLPVAIANNMETWFVTDQYLKKLFESNHEVSKFIQTMC